MEGERLVVYPRLSSIVRNTVVVVREPGKPDRKLLKRVVGVPGESVEFKEGSIWINDQHLLEQHLNSFPAVIGLAGAAWNLGCDELFVMGDNRGASSDSRHWGPIRMDNVIGKVLADYNLPFDVGFIKETE